MHWMSVKLPDNVQMREYSQPCRFHINAALRTILWLSQNKYSVYKRQSTEGAIKKQTIQRNWQSKIDNPEKLAIWVHKTTKQKRKRKKKRLFLITYQEGSNHICQPDCLNKNPSAIYRKKAMMLFPELIQ